MHHPDPSLPKLTKLSVVIPARNEEGCIESTVSHLHLELNLHGIPHEIVVVDDGSTDRTWRILSNLKRCLPDLSPVQNSGPNGFGRAVVCGLNHATGDAVVIMMADESDDCRDVVRYWQKLNEGYDCVFGSRFMPGGGVIDYPKVKLLLNRIVNTCIRWSFGIRLNDTTNAFKAYRKSVIEGCQPLIAPHFNLTVEIPLKAIIRGYSWTTIPITWRNRRTGQAKLKIKEMGSRYLFIILYLWLEKFFSCGDYRKATRQHSSGDPQGAATLRVALGSSISWFLRPRVAYSAYVIVILFLLFASYYNFSMAFSAGGTWNVFPLLSRLGGAAMGILVISSFLEAGANGKRLLAAGLGSAALFVHAVGARQNLVLKGGFAKFVTSDVLESTNLSYGRSLAENFLSGKGFIRANGEMDPFRMPGYPAFVALVRAASGRTFGDVVGLTAATILAQALLFGLAVGLSVILLSRLTSFPAAFVGTAIAVCVPVGVIYTQADTIMPSLILLSIGAIAAVLARRRGGGHDLACEDVVLHAIFLIATFVRHDVLPGWIAVSLILYWRRPRNLLLPVALFASLALPWAAYKNAHGHGFTPFPISFGHVGIVGAFEGPPNDFGLAPSDRTVEILQETNGRRWASVGALKFTRDELLRFWLTYPFYNALQACAKFADFFGVWYRAPELRWPASCRKLSEWLADGLAFYLFVVAVAAFVAGFQRREVLLFWWPVLFQLPPILLLQSGYGRYTTGAFMALPVAGTILIASGTFWITLRKRWKTAASIFITGVVLWHGRQAALSSILGWETLRYAKPFASANFTVIQRREAVSCDLETALVGNPEYRTDSPAHQVKFRMTHPNSGQEIARVALGKMGKGTGIRPTLLVESGCVAAIVVDVAANSAKLAQFAWNEDPRARTASFDVPADSEYGLILADGGTPRGRELLATVVSIEMRVPQPIAVRKNTTR